MTSEVQRSNPKIFELKYLQRLYTTSSLAKNLLKPFFNIKPWLFSNFAVLYGALGRCINSVFKMIKLNWIELNWIELNWIESEASFGGLGGPSPPRKKKKRKKERKERKKEKRERKEKKREKRKKGTMNSVKLLHIKCCFFQFFNSPLALKNKKKFASTKKKLKWRPWIKLKWNELNWIELNWIIRNIPTSPTIDWLRLPWLFLSQFLHNFFIKPIGIRYYQSRYCVNVVLPRAIVCFSRIRFDLKTVDYLRGIKYLYFTSWTWDMIFIRHWQDSNSEPVPSQVRAKFTRPQWQTVVKHRESYCRESRRAGTGANGGNLP